MAVEFNLQIFNLLYNFLNAIQFHATLFDQVLNGWIQISLKFTCEKFNMKWGKSEQKILVITTRDKLKQLQI